MGMEGGVEAAAPAPLKQEGDGEREEGLTMVERRGGQRLVETRGELRLVERRGSKHGRDALVHSPGGGLGPRDRGASRPRWGQICEGQIERSRGSSMQDEGQIGVARRSRRSGREREPREYDQNMSIRRGDSAARERNQVEVETKKERKRRAGGQLPSAEGGRGPSKSRDRRSGQASWQESRFRRGGLRRPRLGLIRKFLQLSILD
jgi:hypothetical protein